MIGLYNFVTDLVWSRILFEIRSNSKKRRVSKQGDHIVDLGAFERESLRLKAEDHITFGQECLEFASSTMESVRSLDIWFSNSRLRWFSSSICLSLN